jgi:2-oxoglutarate ferredoxin oxidoreductase subunit gamma
VSVPVNDIAKELGNVRTANIVALAAFNARSRLVDPEVLRDCVREEFERKAKLIPINMQAFDAGIAAGQALG